MTTPLVPSAREINPYTGEWCPWMRGPVPPKPESIDLPVGDPT